MKKTTAKVYRCPHSGSVLELEITNGSEGAVTEGVLKSPEGKSYPVKDGTAHLIDLSEERFTEDEEREIRYYQDFSDSYDQIMDWLFESFSEDEGRVREGMVDLLNLKPGSRVLETGCGTCRDSVRIAKRLGPDGELFLQDLSPEMLEIGRARMEAANGPDGPQLEFFVGNAVRLPFPDEYFDATFHFGGLNLFPDKAHALREMARVTRKGGKVAVGDESLGPWLASTTYGKILLNSNHLYRYKVPMEDLPENARDVCLRWLIGNSFYLIDFTVGEGAPPVDLDKPILGRRGGTHRTRYYGGVEGVTPEAKDMILKASQKAGVSLHTWLDNAVRAQFSAEQSQK